jgi:hypothetical protein
MSVFHNNVLAGAAGQGGAAAAAEYVIPKSLRFNSGDSAHLSRTPSSAGNRRTWTWSGWVKRNKLGTEDGLFVCSDSNANSEYVTLYFNTANELKTTAYSGGSIRWRLTTNGVFRDPSAWTHIVLAVDTTQATNSNRVKLYINGVQETSFRQEDYPSQNYEGRVNKTEAHAIGSATPYNTWYGDFQLADIQFVDGQALAPTDFGETRESDGVWVPKEYTFGTNPNNGTTWSSTYSAAFAGNAMTDSATVGSLTGVNSSITITLAESVTVASSLELNLYANVSSFSTYTTVSINGTSQTANMSLVNSTGSNSGVWKVTGFTGTLTSITLGAQGGANNGISRVIVDGFTLLNGAGDNSFHLNFSDSSTNEALGFDSAPTTPDPDPKKGFDVILYDGTYATLNIGGLNFEPGLVWIKNRDSATSAHFLADSVRGGTKVLQSNSTGAENTRSNHILSFNPDGFTLGADGTSNYPSGDSFVAWTWRAGGPAVSNTDGTITSQVSANTDYGFSIVSWEGNGSSSATVGHGLSSTPKWVIVKGRKTTDSWSVHHTSLTSGHVALFNSANGSFAASTAGGGGVGAPTSSTLTFINGTSSVNNVNQNTKDFIAYCWSEVAGYSKFGSYTGDGSEDGPFIETGFKPRWILIKSTYASNPNAHSHWLIYDTERNPTNEADDILLGSVSGAELSSVHTGIDILDNGFKLKGDGGGYANYNTNQYIYAAFADRPGNNWDVNNIVTNEGLTTSKTQFDVVTYTGNGGTQKIGGEVYSSYGDNTNINSSYPWTKAFDGVATGVYTAGAGAADGAGWARWTPPDGIAVSSSLRINTDNGTTSAVKVKFVGQTVQHLTSLSDGWTTVTGTGTLEYIEIYNSGNTWSYLCAVEVDGTVLIDGNGPGLKFQPDLVWLKKRNGATSHQLADSVRGATSFVRANTTGAEVTDANTLKSFNSDGFTVGSDAATNGNNDTFVAWCWKAGGTAVSNTDGSVTSSVSANAAYGFSIVSYTGNATDDATFGHGLNKVPELIIVKNRSSADDWFVYTKPTEGNILKLNSTDAKGSSSHFRTMTSSTFQLSGNADVNANNDNFIAYCFANVPGYQRIGSYTGNGSSTGPVVVTGFKPKFILLLLQNKPTHLQWSRQAMPWCSMRRNH